MINEFASTAFQSSLTVGGILFGVLGFLYSIYAEAVLKNPVDPAGISRTIKYLCRWLIAISVLNFVSLLTSNILLIRSLGFWETVICWSLVSTMASVNTLGAWLVIRKVH